MRRSRPTGTDGSFFGGWADANARAVPDIDKARRARRRRLTAGGTLAVIAAATVTTTVLLPGTSANADPSATSWYRLRMCESSNNYSINTGNGHYGAYQFDLSTWRSVGGSGYPQLASKAEQDARALILYRERGWQPWQCARILGLRDDKDAGSGRISDIAVGKTTPVSSSTAVPAFPGSRWYTLGDNNTIIKTFQNQMHKRGYFPAGTGQYGPLTLTMVKKLQSLNGLVPNGYLGPNTWRMAWIGRFTAAVTSKPVSKPVAAVPAFPGRRWYTYGDNNSVIKTFQNQMHKRGYFPAGTGQYGPLTLTMVKKLQSLNGLAPTGEIGPKTWKLAWTGRYTA